MQAHTTPARGGVLALWVALAAASPLALPACVASDEAVHEEPQPGDELADGKADGASGALWTYYAVLRQDARGGVWVRRLNQPDTKCADGGWASECYVASIDWSRSGLSPADAAAADGVAHELRALLRGKLVKVGASSAFQATETWESPTTGLAGGLALRVRASAACDSGACAELRGTKLNKGGQSTATYARVEGEGLDADRAALAGEDGLIVVGTASTDGGAKVFAATQGWARRAGTEGASDRTEGPTCSATALTTFPKDELRIHVIDVGQGDAIWVQTPWKSARSESRNVLIDAGASGAMPGSSPGGETVVAYLLAAGLEEGDVLDALVVTHAHDDHFGGVPRVTESFGVARYTDPGFSAGSSAFLAARKAARDDVAEHGGETQVPAVGELVPRLYAESDLFGPRVEATLLWAAEKPPNGNTANPTGPDVNNTSVALAIRYGGRQALLMGDIESPVEAALIEAHDAGELDLAASVLKVAHHGSSRATSTELLARVFPKKTADAWAIISSGRRTFTGSYLPTEATLERLHAALPDKHVLSTEDRDEHKVVGTEHGDDTVLVRIKASGQVSACYVP